MAVVYKLKIQRHSFTACWLLVTIWHPVTILSRNPIHEAPEIDFFNSKLDSRPLDELGGRGKGKAGRSHAYISKIFTSLPWTTVGWTIVCNRVHQFF